MPDPTDEEEAALHERHELARQRLERAIRAHFIAVTNDPDLTGAEYQKAVQEFDAAEYALDAHRRAQHRGPRKEAPPRSDASRHVNA